MRRRGQILSRSFLACESAGKHETLSLSTWALLFSRRRCVWLRSVCSKNALLRFANETFLFRGRLGARIDAWSLKFRDEELQKAWVERVLSCRDT